MAAKAAIHASLDKELRRTYPDAATQLSRERVLELTWMAAFAAMT